MTIRATRARSRPLTAILRWVDAGAPDTEPSASTRRRVDWLRVLPFVTLHVACLGVIWVGWSPVAVLTAAALYGTRMFAVTAFYHRYFSHRSFKTNRFWQLVFAVLGNSAVQRGPLWWAAHHRKHHRRSDRREDVHSPRVHGFWWSHIGWITAPANFATDLEAVPDLARYPELRFLDRFNVLVPVLLAVSLWGFGALLESVAPQLGTSGMQMLVWGFFISTTVLFHASVTINSLAHRFGRRRYATADDSRNNWLLALLTFGEGWHNNHHHYPASTRQGFFWWEIDVTWYVLKVFEKLGIVRDLKAPPARILRAANRETA